MALIDVLEKEYERRYYTQEVMFDKCTSLNDLNLMLKDSKNRGMILDIAERYGISCLKLFRNVYVVNDLGYGGVCDKCNDLEDLIIVYIKELEDDIDFDRAVCLPSKETYTFRPMHPQDGVCAFSIDNLRDNNVIYKNFCCNSEWKYLKYDNEIGLYYSDEEAFIMNGRIMNGVVK